MAKKKAPTFTPPTIVPVHPDDQELALRGLAKKRAGERLHKDEVRAIRRVERARERELRWRFYRTIPMGHWVQMSGRTHRQIIDQARRYGLPIGGPVIDLVDLAQTLHALLAEKWTVLLRAKTDGDPLLQGSGSPALEEYRKTKAALSRLELAEREGLLVSRERIHMFLGKVAERLRRLGQDLERGFGPIAAGLVEDALHDLETKREA